jgi:hypothetical protein
MIATRRATGPLAGAQSSSSLQGTRKTIEGRQHPDRNAQFEHINRQTKAQHAAGHPVISVDTKKKELVGEFANKGREWQPAGEPSKVLVHDFPSDAVGKAIPYGVYDVGRNEGWVNVGVDHDTACAGYFPPPPQDRSGFSAEQG